MLTQCLACARALPANDELEHMPMGERLAFDARRGRLWVICRWCAHWSLIPLESRWEAVEELERQATDRGVVRAATDHIALVELGTVRAVRIGRSRAHEEAWWRFGTALRGRQLRHATISRIAGTLAAAGAVTGMAAAVFVPVLGEALLFNARRTRRIPGQARRRGADAALSFDRWLRFGHTAWSGAAPCETCGYIIESMPFRERHRATVLPDGSVTLRCGRCGSRAGAGIHLTGTHAEAFLRRVLAYENQRGATEPELQSAVALIAAGHLPLQSGAAPLPLLRPAREQLLALEVIVLQRTEARLLGEEVAQLDARWRLEEELAAIIDGELTPAPPAPPRD